VNPEYSANGQVGRATVLFTESKFTRIKEKKIENCKEALIAKLSLFDLSILNTSVNNVTINFESDAHACCNSRMRGGIIIFKIVIF